jgi:formylglycine-generating enzyme required for sulfatase activity
MQKNVFWRLLFSLCVTATLGTSSIALGAAGVSNPAGIDWVPFSGFSLARTETTVGQFRRFAQATGSLTRAEREGGGAVFEAGWVQKPGWTWAAPFGGDRGELPRMSRPCTLALTKPRLFAAGPADACQPTRSGSAPPTPNNAERRRPAFQQTVATVTPPATHPKVHSAWLTAGLRPSNAPCAMVPAWRAGVATPVSD